MKKQGLLEMLVIHYVKVNYKCLANVQCIKRQNAAFVALEIVVKDIDLSNSRAISQGILPE